MGGRGKCTSAPKCQDFHGSRVYGGRECYTQSVCLTRNYCISLNKSSNWTQKLPISFNVFHQAANKYRKETMISNTLPSGKTWIPFFCWLLFCVVELLSPGNLGPSVVETVFPGVFKFCMQTNNRFDFCKMIYNIVESIHTHMEETVV